MKRSNANFAVDLLFTQKRSEQSNQKFSDKVKCLFLMEGRRWKLKILFNYFVNYFIDEYREA